jgi:hypothetical protein
VKAKNPELPLTDTKGTTESSHSGSIRLKSYVAILPAPKGIVTRKSLRCKAGTIILAACNCCAPVLDASTVVTGKTVLTACVKRT